MKKIAVLLSGCGVFDGSEIHEAVLTLLALSKAGVSYQCFAPDIPQLHVVNHLSGEVASEQRNVLVEAARIARGDIKATADLEVTAFDGLIIPGGFGAAKNLCDFALAGADTTLTPAVDHFIRQFIDAKKVIGFICIAPVMIPKLYGKGAKGTIGSDADTVSAFCAMGGEHIEATVADIVVDNERKIVSTPAYMLAGSIAEANTGIEKLVTKVLELA
ncbi:isoprenoid biosynthesis glyoxalase ElbB [Shewanella sp. 4t3-1-2LB]|uniref:isoprenoid biosynthesis glyoxalase ElbB n=1 Tax=Shewanella sp. 4t3-1-2LB TaxID=2817682 RepID=UPI001A99F938|nr:isoprenoid biosynthesis glyoxalase ElbB [Shewanella sp. 4t3-1-2LB]MBO1271049.1 isoprenoid biosynthesis glyoxalase ElbB [Shewanella sp. 4t3-1-2LB]